MAIALSTGQLESWVAQGFFPFTRIGACLMVAPVFGARFVPTRTRVLLAVAITALVVPLTASSGIAPFSAQGFVVVAQQLLIVNLAFGVVSRAAPSLNLFAVGFPVSLVVGLLVVLAGIGPLSEGVTQLIAQGLDFLRGVSGL